MLMYLSNSSKPVKLNVNGKFNCKMNFNFKLFFIRNSPKKGGYKQII